MPNVIEQRQLPSTRTRAMCLALGLSASTVMSGGCAPSAYKYTLRNVEHIERLLNAVPHDSEAKQEEQAGSGTRRVQPPAFMEFPRIKARHCLKRAIENYCNSRLSTGFDATMLVLAGVGAGIGTSMGSAVAAMDDSNPSRKNVGIASVTMLAAAGAVLGLRAALNLNEVGRMQKVAAARDVNAAINIIERYALVDDPKDVGEDGFATCRDADINIANSLPGAKSAEPIEAVIAKAKIYKAEQASTAAAAAKTSVEKRTEADEAQNKVKQIDSAIEAQKSMSEPARALAAQGLAAAKAALTELEARAKEAEAKAKLEAAKARVAEAQVDVAEKKGAVMDASGQLRRAIFFLTAQDVRIAERLLNESFEALNASRVLRKAAQEQLDAILTPPSR